MKRIKNYILVLVCAFGFSSCADMFLDLEPLDAKSDLIYFKTPQHFREYANGLYGQLLGWQSPYGGIFEHMDAVSDLSTCLKYSWGVGTGVMTVPYVDGRWDNCYANIRATNMMFEKAVSSYTGNIADIKNELAEGHFFRAYNYFYLLKFFGGVPIVKKVLDVTSAELRAPRNSRYEVVEFILSDLQDAIDGLPMEQSVDAADKGRISKQAAQAFKARVLLYEATWRKYNGTTTDYEGSTGPASDQVNAFLEECISLSETVMKDNAYSIWNYNMLPEMKNMSNRYLFNIEEEASNPAKADRSSNKEFIIASIYSQDTRKGQVSLNRVIHSDMRPSRKLIDMFLCTDGLPICMSDKFQGYHKPGDEFKNRDYRLMSYIGSYSSKLTVEDCGYGTEKFAIEIERNDKDESANYPVLRLAEVYLNYAEAVMERYGTITDEQLEKSINKIRIRAGIAKLTNALAQKIQQHAKANPENLDLQKVMLNEIRRERALELFMEGFRCDDLKRWGIAEKMLNQSRCGMVVGNKDYPTSFVNSSGEPTADYLPKVFTKGTEEVETGAGKLPCVVLLKASDCDFGKNDYLWAIPRKQIDLNPNLVQNPGY